MSESHQEALTVGKAAEYLVCADLLLSGIAAFPSDQGLPYDVVAEVDGSLVRIQVKATRAAKNVAAANRAPRHAYSWNVRQNGRGGRQRLSKQQCDVVALVALDIRAIAYLPLQDCGTTIQLVAPGSSINANDARATWRADVTGFPFRQAIDGTARLVRGTRQLCRNGHPWTVDNTKTNSQGHRVCLVCQGANG